MKTIKSILFFAATFLLVSVSHAQHFTAVKNDARIDLTWNSDTDTTIDHFVIERSYNGSDFNEIALVFAFEKKADRYPYRYFDKTSSLTNSSIYYRIHYSTKDGKEGYYSTQLVELEKKDSKTELAQPY